MKKSNLFLFIFFLFGSCECSQEPLEEVLGLPCQPLVDGGYEIIRQSSKEYKKLNEGPCSTGITQKDKNSNTICVGFIDKQLDLCDGIDNDCNTLVDDGWLNSERFYYDPRNTCNDDVMGVCFYSSEICIEGQFVCVPPSNYGPEQCDGLDNDCDGDVDEDTQEDPIFSDGERYVYTAEPDTINIGECRAGYKECVDGVVSIRNMRTPVPEICGNDDDDDCDGLTDERETGLESIDYALIIDYSGSMSDTIDSVANALCDWSTQGVLSDSRFAVIGIGYVDYTDPTIQKEIKVLTDFTDAGTACNVIRTNNYFTHFGGLEYQLNATFDASDPSSINGYVSWLNNNRKVLIFSDEMLQQDFAPSIQEAIDIVVEQCIDTGYIIGAFINYNTPDQQLWVDLTQRCGGFLDYISPNPQQMIDTLNYWVGEDC